MASHDLDAYWMQRALELARRGIAVTSPNPPVGGGILDRAGQGVGEAWHEYDLLDHAEIIALRVAQQHAGDRLHGGTAYVTLEPCNHTGRTGPCTEAIIAAGVSRVVAAVEDPNPKTQGTGFARLRAAGIEVEGGLLEDNAQELNEAFAHWVTTKKPFVTLKSALTLDGQLALPKSLN